MKDYRFAIIGCGKISGRHATQIASVGKLAAVCDIVPSRTEELAARYNAVPYYSINDLLRHEPGLDVVSVCTPNYLHAEHSIASLEAGFHVLCEKPLAISMHDAERMQAAAVAADRRLFVVKSTRFNPPVQSVKNLIAAGGLGKIFSFQLGCFWNRPAAYYADSWRGKLETDGGTLFTQFSHYIDVLYWLLGPVKTCFPLRKNFAHGGIVEFEDTGAAAIEMESGAIGTINYSVNCYRKNMEVSLVLVAEKGTVKIGGEYLNKLEYQQLEEGSIPALPSGNAANDYGFYRGSMGNHKDIYENLVKALSDARHPFTDVETGMQTIKIIEQLYASPLL
ncbi:MAG: Gfo/Idh/MocA family oxidoreductase [Williamsia sp.]|nr:Gfo/Idh/MocA family oxidoreductase [Williamsia sp.]